MDSDDYRSQIYLYPAEVEVTFSDGSKTKNLYCFVVPPSLVEPVPIGTAAHTAIGNAIWQRKPEWENFVCFGEDLAYRIADYNILTIDLPPEPISQMTT